MTFWEVMEMTAACRNVADPFGWYVAIDHNIDSKAHMGRPLKYGVGPSIHYLTIELTILMNAGLRRRASGASLTGY